MNSETEQMRPRILFAPIAAGGAHVSTAQALAEAVDTYYPGQFDLEIAELMPLLGFGRLDRRHKLAWRRALERPWSVRLGQALSDRLPRASVWLQRRLLDGFAERLADYVRQAPPALIVATHGWTSTALALAKRRHGLDVPVVTFVTLTVDAAAVWADPWAQRYLIGASRGKRVLAAMGVPEQHIDVVGYPVKQRFLGPPEQARARRTLNLKEQFTCLIVLGGEGVGNIPREVVAWLSDLPFSVQVVVIAGRNAGLKRDLEALELTDLHVAGFVTNMETYMAACDVVVGKVSGATVFEALAVGRPVLATRKSYRSEDEYIRYLGAKGLGAFCPDRESLQAQVTAYYEQPKRLQDVVDRTRDLDFSGMSRRLANYLVTYLKTEEPDPKLCGNGVGWP